MEMQYIRVGDYFIPDLELPQESRPIGRWGRLHREYLREQRPIQYNCLLLSGKLWTWLADVNEQAQDRLEQMIDLMKVSEGITEALSKRPNGMGAAYEQYPRQSRGNCPRGADLCMKMEEYFRVLETYVESRKLNLGDCDSVLSLLYEEHGDINQM